MERAAELLREAGWVIEDGALVHEQTGEPFHIRFVAVSPALGRAFIAYTRILERLGISASIKAPEISNWLYRMRSGDFDAGAIFFLPDNTPTLLISNTFSSAAADAPYSDNWSGLKDPAVDALIGHVYAAKNWDDFVAALRALDRVLLWNFYWMPNTSKTQYPYVRWDKFGRPEHGRLLWVESLVAPLVVGCGQGGPGAGLCGVRVVGRYILKRLALIVPTLFGIMLVNFIIVQFAPGGPVEQALADAAGFGFSSTAAASSAAMGPSGDGGYAGSSGLDPELVARLEQQFGFDKPAHERFLLMMWNYLRLDFGDSYFQDRAVVDLVLERLPVSVSLGLWSLLLIYAISIPLGIAKAVRDGQRFDVLSSAVIFTAYAIPGFLFAILLIVLFAGGSYLDWFPLRGLTSDNFDDLRPVGQVGRLPVALGAALDGADHRRLRHLDHAHQEQLPGGVEQALRAHCPGQGADRAAGAVRACLPQRHADCDRRLSRRLCRHSLHRRLVDRSDLPTRRHWPARL